MNYFNWNCTLLIQHCSLIITSLVNKNSSHGLIVDFVLTDTTLHRDSERWICWSKVDKLRECLKSSGLHVLRIRCAHLASNATRCIVTELPILQHGFSRRFSAMHAKLCIFMILTSASKSRTCPRQGQSAGRLKLRRIQAHWAGFAEKVCVSGSLTAS
jgi:hypothetical protein